MASEWQTAFVVSHKMPWYALLTAVKNYNKSLEKLQDFFSRPRPRPNVQDQDQDQMFKTKTKTSWFKTKTKTFIFVLEAPRDQDPDLEDYMTAFSIISIFEDTRELCEVMMMMHSVAVCWHFLLCSFVVYSSCILSRR